MHFRAPGERGAGAARGSQLRPSVTTLSTKLVLALVAAAAIVAAAAPDAVAEPEAVSEETALFFKQNCTSCHTIGGGRLTGPDLRDVGTRKDRAWLAKFIADPKAVIDSGDAYGQQLLREARGVYMTQVPGLSKDRIEKILDLVEIESSLEKSQFAGMQISDRPLVAADVDRGRMLFEGRERFIGGGPACMSCHTIGGDGGTQGFGGGTLGPDLSGAYARLGGRKPTAAWLAAPPGVTMLPVFQKNALDAEEILALTAYLKDAAERGPQDAVAPAPFEFLLAGIGGLVVALIGLDFAWRGRSRGVRRALVEGARR